MPSGNDGTPSGFLSRADILANGGDRWMSKGKESTQYFRRLKLKDVASIERPSLLPEDKSKKDRLEEIFDAEDTEPAAHSHEEKGRKPKHRNEEPFEVVIPLGNDRMKSSDIRKSLKAEYAARYLEKLGASPTPANLNLIWKYAGKLGGGGRGAKLDKTISGDNFVSKQMISINRCNR